MTTNTTPSFPPARRDPRQLTNTLKRTVNFTDSDVLQFSFQNSLPQGAFITNVLVEVVTAFNAVTTNQMSVGTNTTSFNNIIANGDVAMNSTGVTKVSRGLGRSLTAAQDTSVFGTITVSGTSATTGTAIILIEFEGGWGS